MKYLRPYTLPFILMATQLDVHQFYRWKKYSKSSLIFLIITPIIFIPLSFIHGQDKIQVAHQNNTYFENCDYYESHTEKLGSDNLYRKTHEQYESQIAYYNQTHSLSSSSASSYTLPVVVHIVHQNGNENISLSQVQEGMIHLNEAYSNSGYYDKGLGVDTEISFCLSKRKPDGSATEGVNRINSPLTKLNSSSDDLKLKNLSRWDPTQYINIWLVDEICRSNNAGCGVAGYAYLPAAHGRDFDGIVMEAKYFGSSRRNSGVIIHEIGHYLGLYHTFQGGCKNDDCLSDGDKVCDTPPDASTVRVPCDDNVNSCQTDTKSGFNTDQNDHFWNFMDYGDLACYAELTAGQKTRMHSTIQGIRSSLLDSKACEIPCNNIVEASYSIPSNELEVGQSLNFSNTSQNSETYTWKINGMNFSTERNPTYTFNDAGTFVVTLIAQNSDSDCFGSEYRDTINVICPVKAEFSLSNEEVIVGETISSTNNSMNGTSYIWTLNGNFFSDENNIDFTPGEEKIYKLCLQASDGLCNDKVCRYLVANVVQDTCESLTFYKNIGKAGSKENGHSIIPLNNGSLLIAGSRADNSILINTDIKGNILWTREFDFITGNEKLIKIDIDNQGLLYGLGRNSSSKVLFYFKYDIEANEMLWLKKSNFGYTSHDLIQLSDNGNYILSSNDDIRLSILLSQIDRETGGINFTRKYDLENTESTKVLKEYQGFIYGVGRYTYNAIGSENFRAALTKYDKLGNELYSKVFHISHGQNARLYTASLVFHSDNIYILGSGDDDGTSLVNTSVFLYKFTLEGEMVWTKKYRIGGALTNKTTDLITLNDGLLLKGNFTSEKKKTYLLKTSFSGEVQWCKSYGDSSTAHDNFLRNSFLSVGDYIYMVSSTQENDGDILFIKTNLEGETSFPCDMINPVNVTYEEVVDAKAFDVDLIEDTPGLTSSDASSLISEIDIQENDICKLKCKEICNNGIDDDGDGLIDCEDNIDCPTPDLRVSVNSNDCFNGTSSVILEICNNDSLPIGPEIPVGVYLGDPLLNSDAQLIDTFHISKVLSEQECITKQWGNLDQNVEYFFIVNDDGSHSIPIDLETDLKDTTRLECTYENNITSVTINHSIKNLDLGPDISVCDNGVMNLEVDPSWYKIQWSDGSETPDFTTHLPGKHWVQVIDSCGNVNSDTVKMIFNPTTKLDLGQDTVICSGQGLRIGSNNFNSYQWHSNSPVPCDTCDFIEVTPDSAITYSLTVADTNGCYSHDSINIQIAQDTIFSTERIEVCQGDSAKVFGDFYSSDSVFTKISDISSCVRIDSIILEVLDTFSTREQIIICEGDTANVFGNPRTNKGVYIRQFQSVSGCDSTHTIEVMQIDTHFTQETITICKGDSIKLFDQYQSSPGIYSNSYIAENGCDSTHAITLSYHPEIDVEINSNPSCENVNSGKAWVIVKGGKPPYSYVWDHTDLQDSVLYGLKAGEYSLTISDENNCKNITTISVDSSIIKIEEINVQDVSCYGFEDGTISVNANQGSIEYALSQDSIFQNDNRFSGLAAGEYDVIIRNENNCYLSQTVTINSPEELLVQLPADTTIEYGDTIDIYTRIEGNYELIQWKPPHGLSCIDCIHPNAFPGNSTQYFITLIDSLDCEVTDDIRINIDFNSSVYVPNAFTPNGDGINDFFEIYTGNAIVEITSFEIYNKWGSRVFQAENNSPNSHSIKWDGKYKDKLCSQGIYVWKAIIRDAKGQTRFLSGELTLLR